jgi:hypothetical protein
MSELYGLRLSIGDGSGKELVVFNLDALPLANIEQVVKIATQWLSEMEASPSTQTKEKME